MAKRKKQPGANTVALPGSSDAGRAVHPEALPTETDAGDAGGDTPLGLPISLEQYEALQTDAKHRKPQHRGIAQGDPGEP